MPRRFFGKNPNDPEVDADAQAEDNLIHDAETVEHSALDDEGESESAHSSDTSSDQLQGLRREVAELKDRYMRTLADLDNIKKRHIKERSELQRYAGENMARDLLTILDDLERACAQSAEVNTEELLTGVRMICDQFLAVLERHGITASHAVGEQFDPKHHEALATVPTGDHPSGTVIEQFKKAYFMRDKLLRPAQVVVSSALPEPQAGGESDSDSGESE